MVREAYQAVADATQAYEAGGPGPHRTPGAKGGAGVCHLLHVSVACTALCCAALTQSNLRLRLPASQARV